MSERAKAPQAIAEAAPHKRLPGGEFVPNPSAQNPDSGKPARDIRSLLVAGADGVTLLTPPRVDSLRTGITYRRSGEGPFAKTVNTCNASCAPQSCDACPPDSKSGCNGKNC